MNRRGFLGLLGVAPIAPLVAALAPLTPPDPPAADALVMEGNQITFAGKNVFHVTLRMVETRSHR